MDIDYEIIKSGEVNKWPQSVTVAIRTSWGDANFSGRGSANEKALYLLEEAYREAKRALEGKRGVQDD